MIDMSDWTEEEIKELSSICVRLANREIIPIEVFKKLPAKVLIAVGDLYCIDST